MVSITEMADINPVKKKQPNTQQQKKKPKTRTIFLSTKIGFNFVFGCIHC